jgi:predicted Fe-Mo cluster-binding NifX family protein
MKIAIASQHSNRITGHTGKCREFQVYETDGQTITEHTCLNLSKAQTFHESSPQAAHPLDEIQVLICGGVGKGLLHRLTTKGIDVVVTQETAVDQAITDYLQGTLATENPITFGHDHLPGQSHVDGEPCGCASA